MNTPQLPEAFQAVFGLGGVKTFYPIKGTHKIGNVIFGLIFLAMGGALFVYAIYEAWVTYQTMGPALVWNNFWAPALIGSILGSLSLIGFWGAYNNWNKAIVLYENGIAYNDRKGLRAWRWDEIASITSTITKHYTNGIYTGTTHNYTLIHNQGEKINFNDGFGKVEDLANAIREQIFPLLYKKAADAYNSGQTVVFGQLSISRDGGLQMGKKTYPWAEIKQVSIEQGYIKVAQKGGGWFSGAAVMAGATPNLDVALSLINQLVGIKRK